MQFVTQLFGSLERLLRWVYPGLLFLALLGGSQPVAFKLLVGIERPWGVVVSGLVVGFVIYMLQRSVVSLLLQSVCFWGLHWEQREPRRWTRRLVGAMDTWVRREGNKWGSEELVRYQNFAWGSYHALSMTGWLIILFVVLWVEPQSPLGSIRWWLLLPSILLLVASVWEFMFLIRLEVSRYGYAWVSSD
ncbi:MAG: hypothetical protein AB1597_05500 [Chloroflexota bacterium]